MILPRRTPAEPGTRQHTPPLIPDPGAGEKNPSETAEPYDLPFPDHWPHRPEYVIVVDQLRDWQPGLPPSLAELLETGPRRPAIPSLTWKPNHDPHPEVTAMTLTINDATMTSDQTPHTARHAPGRPGWEVSWLPGRTVDRNTAITAMILADTAAEEDLHEGHRLWPHVQSWAAELGLTGPDAIARSSRPPVGLRFQHDRENERPDPEAGQ